MIYIDEKKLTAYVIDEDSKKVTIEVELIPKELACLLCLIKAEGMCVTREFLLDNLWDSIVTDASLNNLVKNIRAKIFSLTGDADVIITAHKKGYRIDINKIAFYYEITAFQPEQVTSRYIIFNHYSTKQVTVLAFLLGVIFILLNISTGRDFDSVQVSKARENTLIQIDKAFITTDFYLKSWRYRFFVYDNKKRLLIRETGFRFSIFDDHFLVHTSIMFDVDYPNAALLANAEKRYNPSVLRKYNIVIEDDRCELYVEGYKALFSRSYDKEKDSCSQFN